MNRRLLLHAGLALACSACSFDTNDGDITRANEALHAGQVDKARTSYDEAAARLPESPELNLDRGLAASLAGDHEAAAAFLLRALATKDPALLQRVKAALGLAYAREALALERTPPPEAPAEAAPSPDAGAEKAPKIPEAALAKWKLAVEFLSDAVVLDPNDLASRRSLEVALLRVDPPCATRDDAYETNDSADAAKPLEFKAPEPTQSQVDPSTGAPAAAPTGPQELLRVREQLFSCPDNDDWFDLKFAAGDRLSLTPTVPKGAGRLEFTLLHPDGSVAWTFTSSDDAKEELSEFKAIASEKTAGNWKLKVRNLDFDEVSYGLAATLRPPCQTTEDRFEDNDTAALAQLLTPGPVPDLKLCPADPDWFAVNLGEGDSLFVYLNPTAAPEEGSKAKPDAAPSPPPITLTIYDATGTRRATGAPADRALVSTLLTPGPGRYLIEVTSPAGDDPAQTFEGRYQLQLEVVPPCPEGDDRFEDNDVPEDATDFAQASAPPPAAQGAQPAQQGPPVVFARVCPGDVDWWKLSSTGEKPEIVSLTFDHAQGDLALELFDATGVTSLAHSDTSSPTQNAEALPLPAAPKPDPSAAPPAAPATPTTPPPSGAASAPPTPTTYTLQVRAVGDAQNFYLLRLDNPSGGGGGGEGDSQDESKDQNQDSDSKSNSDKNANNKSDSKSPDEAAPDPDKTDDKAPPEKQDPLKDALDNLDRNPDNLPARDAAKRSPLANQKPLKDW